ncbi:hypothetical protein F5X97DRAFT_227837 [Nemania serpens]|nr:hypothetical protein F5X97DRAFT_227837 [Nemania serpens]
MNSGQHLQIINPVRRGTRSFPLFPTLPVELRLDIWEVSLKRGRLINISLTPRKENGAHDQDEGPRYETHNALGNVVSGAQYQVTVQVQGPQLLSKLLRVSREARQAALRFYRVHLPCRLVVGDKEQSAGTLHLNPEFDIVGINPGSGDHDFAHFAHDIRAYDSVGVGLLNLALDLNGVNCLTRIDISDLEPAAQTTFTQTLLNLRQVFFTSIESAGRAYLGMVLSGIHTNDRYEFHRSRPIMSLTPSFDRLARDPRRNMERDLSRVYVGTFDPRRMVCMWQELLHRWNITHQPNGTPVYRLMVSTTGDARSSDIVDRESAAEWLRHEDKRWHSSQLRHADLIKRVGYNLPLESPEELEQAPRPAIGFWLFPIEAIGPVPGPEALEDGNGFVWEAKRVVDMRQYWPELCLSCLT